MSEGCDRENTRGKSKRLSPDLWVRKVLPEKLTLKLRPVRWVGPIEVKREEVGEGLVDRHECVAGLPKN